MSGKVFIIAEHYESDLEISRAFVSRYREACRVVVTTQKKIGGISVLLKHLDRTILDTLHRKDYDSLHDCIAVLHDEDPGEPRRDVYDQVASICSRYQVSRVLAVPHIESWLLGNEGFCDWLGIAAQNCDSDLNAKRRLHSAVNAKTKQSFTASTRTKALQHVSGNNYSASLLAALSYLDDAPCSRP